MSKHTPGPWTVTRVSKSTVLKDLYISASPERIARVVVPSTAKGIEEYEANAFLIAASPELLAIVRRFIDREPYTNQLSRDAKAVVAKATGEQT